MKKLILSLVCVMIPITAGTQVSCQDDSYKYTKPATELRTVEEYQEIVGDNVDYKLIQEAIKEANADCQRALESCPK